MFIHNKNLVEYIDFHSMIFYEKIVHDKFESIVNIDIYDIKYNSKWFELNKQLKHILNRSCIGVLSLMNNRKHISLYEIFFNKDKYTKNSFSFFFYMFKKDIFNKNYRSKYDKIVESTQLITTNTNYKLDFKLSYAYGKFNVILNYF